jgi:uncharacterized protein
MAMKTHTLTRRGPAAESEPHAPPQRTRRRWPLRLAVGLLTLVVVLALLLMGGGGWYFAGQIYQDGLRVDVFEPDYSLEVVGVTDNSITISDPDDREPVLDGSAVYGAHYRSGTATGEAEGFVQLVGQGNTGPEVTRSTEVLAGRPPQVGDLVGVDRSAFPDDPAQTLDRPVQDVAVAGELPGWFVAGESDTWAILVHGKGGNLNETLRMVRTTVELGMPSLVISYRNDVGAPQDEEGMYRYGATEWEDLQAAVEHAQQNGAQDVVLFGISFGGGVVASYLEHVPEAPVTALVLDAPMLDFGETVSYGASQRTLPVLGQVPEAVTWSAKRLASLRYGIDWDEVDYLDDTGWVTVPTFVAHGTADLTVPVTTSEQLAEDRPESVELFTVLGAGHVESWNVDPAGYDEALEAFLTSLR